MIETMVRYRRSYCTTCCRTGRVGPSLGGVESGFSFERIDAGDYEELRAGYAPAAIDWVAERAGLGGGSLLVDLGAGTGRLSREFVLLGLRVVAVEPARNMRSVIERRVQGVMVVGGAAEAIPLADGIADAVVVGNAFHHFDEGRAFDQIRRVLRPGGVLAVFWARPDDDAGAYPGLREVREAIKDVPPAVGIAAAYERWAVTHPRVHGFSMGERREFPTTHVIPSARLADLYATSSDVASVPRPARKDLLTCIRAVSVGLPDMLELPGRSVVDLFERLGPED